MNQHQAKATTITFASICMVATCTSVAEAHSVNKQFGDFYGGMLHPLTALEHLLPILGLGLLAGQQGTASARWVLLLFPLGLLFGAAAASNLEPNSMVEWFNRLSFVALGALVAGAVQAPLAALATLAFVVGLSHGYENTADISSTVVMYLFVPGVVVTGLAIIAVFAAVAFSRKAAWQNIAVRVVGSWIAAVGILMIGVS